MARTLLGRAHGTVVIWVALLGALNAVHLGLLLFLPDPHIRGWVSDLAGIFIPFVAAFASFGAHRQANLAGLSSIRHVPAFLGGAALCYGAGMTLFTLETRYLGLSGNPGWGDLFFLMQYGFFIVAMMLWPSRPIPSVIRWRTWSDAVIVMFALLAFAWAWIVGPAVLDSDKGTLGILIDSAYPTFDLLIILSALQMMRKGFDPRFLIATRVFVAAIMVNTVGDIYFATAQIDGIYASGHWLDATWPLTASMAAVAGLMAKVRMQVQAFQEAGQNDRIILAQRTWVLYAPYVLVPLVGGLVINVSLSDSHPTIRSGLYLIGIGLVIAVLARQMLAIIENNSLYARLRDAVGELESKNRQLSDAAEETDRANRLLREMARKLAGENQSLVRSNVALEEMATTDGMTGLTNHRAFQLRLRQEIDRALADGKALTLALVDVDYFKQYNDDFGHLAGDEVLQNISGLLQGALREGDLAARYGGEEFALLLPGVALDAAVPIMERLRSSMGDYPFAHRKVTLSIGIASLGEECRDAKSILAKADRALYSAKSRGRDQVVSALSASNAA